MRTASILAAALILAACSRNPEPDLEAAGAADTTMSDTTLMAGDSTQMSETGMEGDTAQAVADSALVNQEGDAQPGQQTMEPDNVTGDSTLAEQAGDAQPGQETMEPDSVTGDSTLVNQAGEDAVPMDSTQGQRP